MCLIIQRPKGEKFEEEAFNTWVLNNPDGWGLTFPDNTCDGRLTVIKSVEKGDDDLLKLVNEELADVPLMLHLRYTTAGDTVIRNAHPFPILEQKEDGVDVRMAHNGTISKFKPGQQANNKWESDSRVFTREYVRPLFKRLSLGLKSFDMFGDPFVHDLLSDQIPSASTLGFMDGFGNFMQVNPTGNGGYFTDEGLWFSNKYSSDANHRVTKSYNGYGSNGYWEHGVWHQGQRKTNTTPGKTNKKGEIVPIKKGERFSCLKQEKFSAKYGVTDLSELFNLTDSTLEDLALMKPDDLVLLTKELLGISYIQSKTIAGLKAKVKASDKANV